MFVMSVVTFTIRRLAIPTAASLPEHRLRKFPTIGYARFAV